MELNKLKENIEDNGYENVTLFENPSYADAFIGVTSNGQQAVYDFDLMVEWHMREFGSDSTSAIEDIEYNAQGSCGYDNFPIIIKMLDFSYQEKNSKKNFITKLFNRKKNKKKRLNKWKHFLS